MSLGGENICKNNIWIGNLNKTAMEISKEDKRSFPIVHL